MQNLNDEIIACPACGKPLRKRPLKFGDGAEAVLRTDGKMAFSSRFETLTVVRCAHCQAIFCFAARSKLPKVREVRYQSDSSRSAKSHKPLALASGG